MTQPQRSLPAHPHYASWQLRPLTDPTPGVHLTARGCVLLLLACAVALVTSFVVGQAKTADEQQLLDYCHTVAAPAFVRECVRDLTYGEQP